MQRHTRTVQVDGYNRKRAVIALEFSAVTCCAINWPDC